MLLTTFFDAPCGSDYEGDAWVGNSHESDGAGITRHCLPWIERVSEPIRVAPGVRRKSKMVTNHENVTR